MNRFWIVIHFIDAVLICVCVCVWGLTMYIYPLLILLWLLLLLVLSISCVCLSAIVHHSPFFNQTPIQCELMQMKRSRISFQFFFVSSYFYINRFLNGVFLRLSSNDLLMIIPMSIGRRSTNFQNENYITVDLNFISWFFFLLILLFVWLSQFWRFI